MKLNECLSSLRVELGDMVPAAQKWSDDELARVIRSAVADLDRYLPRVRVYEVTVSPTITDEGFTSAHDVWVELANTQIKPKNETIHDGAGNNFVRGADYHIDYSNGQIMVLSTGTMLDATAYKANYTKSRVSVPISGADIMEDLIRVRSVEYPMGVVPQSMVGFQTAAGHLFITTTAGGTTRGQTELTSGEHIAIVYEAINLPPTVGVDGSYPRLMDHIVLKGAMAYSFFIRAAKLDNKAADDMDSARGQVVDISTVLAAVDTALAHIGTHIGEADTALGKLDGYATQAGTALAKVATEVAKGDTALAKAAIWVDEASQAKAAIISAGTAAASAGTALGKVSASVTAAEAVLGSSKTASDEAKAALEGLAAFIANLNAGITSMMGVWDAEQKTYRDGAVTHLYTGSTLINLVTKGKDPDEMYRRYAEADLQVVAAAASKIEAIAGANLRVVDELNTKLAEAAQDVGRAQALASAGAARVGAANAHAGEAAQYANIMASWTSVVGQSAGVGQVWVGAANIRIASANAFIAEAVQRLNAGSLYNVEATTRLEMARAYIDEASAHLNKIQYMLLSAQQYAALASTGVEVATKFREEGGARHAEYWRILGDRTKWMGERVATSTHQPKA